MTLDNLGRPFIKVQLPRLNITFIGIRSLLRRPSCTCLHLRLHLRLTGFTATFHALEPLLVFFSLNICSGFRHDPFEHSFKDAKSASLCLLLVIGIGLRLVHRGLLFLDSGN